MLLALCLFPHLPSLLSTISPHSPSLFSPLIPEFRHFESLSCTEPTPSLLSLPYMTLLLVSPEEVLDFKIGCINVRILEIMFRFV